MDKQFCLNCENWTPKGEGVGTCQHYGIRLQFEGPRFEHVGGADLQFDCFHYCFQCNRDAWISRRLETVEAETLRRKQDAVYEKMRYDKAKESAVKPYWMEVKQERKQRLDQVVG